MHNTYQKYDCYKDSGVEWLGEIPEEWEVKKLKYILKIKNGQDYKNVISDFGYPVMGSGGQFAYANDFMHDGEVLLLGRKGTIDKPQYFNGKFWTVDTMFYAIAKEGYLTKFLYYTSLTIPFKLYGTSTALPSMTQDDLNNNPVFIPPFKEQTAIANFLDDKTAKIDRAIAQKEQLIALLKERKQIIIQDLVTGKKVWNKDRKAWTEPVEVKDSGVEWIGEIPEHWEVSKAKYYSKIFIPERSKPELDEDSNSGIPWVTTELLGNNNIDFNKVRYFVNRKNAQLAGSRIILRESVLATCVGNFGIASINNFDCIINQQIQGYTKIRLNPFYFIQIVRLSKDFFSNNSTMTTIQYVSKDTFGELPISIPSIQEQNKIVHHIETQSTKIDQAIALQQTQIEKLKEYKATLIDSAVTGKLRVPSVQEIKVS